jgi:hypothetical protein
MSRCRKHWWHKLLYETPDTFKINVSPGAINLFFKPFIFEKCANCGKVRNESK